MPHAEPTRPRSPHDSLRRAVRHVLATRTTSFYMLLAIPLVMLLAVPLFEYRDDPRRFAFLVALQFIFLGVILVRALFDLLEIGLRRYRQERDDFKKTLGDQEFYEELARRVKDREPRA